MLCRHNHMSLERPDVKNCLLSPQPSSSVSSYWKALDKIIPESTRKAQAVWARTPRAPDPRALDPRLPESRPKPNTSRTPTTLNPGAPAPNPEP